MGGLAAERDDEACQDEEDEELDGGHPELGFAEEGDVEELRLCE